MTTSIGQWKVAETPQETVFTLGQTDQWWMFVGAVALVWTAWFMQREAGPWGALDLGLIWGFSLISLLLISMAVNTTEVRVGPGGVARRIGPLPVMEGSARYGRGEIEGVHYWQHATSGEMVYQTRTKPAYKAGLRLKNGKAVEAVGGFRSMEEAQEAAAEIGRRLGLEATRWDRASEPVGWRGVLFLLSIVGGSIIVARMASFVAALLKG